MAEAIVGLYDSGQVEKVEHDLVEMLVVAVCAMLVGVDDSVEIEEWTSGKTAMPELLAPLAIEGCVVCQEGFVYDVHQ